MTADRTQQSWHLCGIINFLSGGQWREKITKDGPSCVRRFGIVKRSFTRSDLSPTGESVCARFHEQNAALPDGSEAGLKRALQPNLNFTDCQRLDLQRNSPPGR